MAVKDWDVFISHAFEDKSSLARPLADLLHGFGIRVWYDEFSLRVGDSLSRSIDKGLAGSHHGVVIISTAFMAKSWTEYELRGLVQLAISENRRILPIWHGVTHADVLSFSPPLADIFALDSSKEPLPTMALRIIETIRPDMHVSIQRYLAFHRLKESAPIMSLPLKAIAPSPIRHATLSQELLIRIKIVYQVLGHLTKLSLPETIDNFRRDMVPEDEVEIWERITTAYLDLTAGRNLSRGEKRGLLGALVARSMRSVTERDVERCGGIGVHAINSAYVDAAPSVASSGSTVVCESETRLPSSQTTGAR